MTPISMSGHQSRPIFKQMGRVGDALKQDLVEPHFVSSHALFEWLAMVQSTQGMKLCGWNLSQSRVFSVDYVLDTHTFGHSRG